MDKQYLKAYDVYADKIVAYMPFSGQAITHFTIRAKGGIAETQPVVDEFAPLYHVRADAPPLY